jgi:hypothetical protein
MQVRFMHCRTTTTKCTIPATANNPAAGMFREYPQSFVLETVKGVNLDIQRCIAQISFTPAQFHKVDHLQTGHVLIIHDTTGAYVMTN